MLIKNGFLIDPATKKSGNYDIRIKNGIITEIGNTLSPAPNEQVTDAAGLTVAPGLIDTHIHLRLRKYGMIHPDLLTKKISTQVHRPPPQEDLLLSSVWQIRLRS